MLVRVVVVGLAASLGLAGCGRSLLSPDGLDGTGTSGATMDPDGRPDADGRPDPDGDTPRPDDDPDDEVGVDDEVDVGPDVDDSPVVGGACAHECTADADCMISGMEFGLVCSPTGTCIFECSDDITCWAVGSGWSFQPCATNDDCLSGPCVDYGAAMGGCATDATANCAEFMQEAIVLNDVEGNEVEVCASTLLGCVDIGVGAPSCGVAPGPNACDQLQCPPPLVCDANEARCGCQADNDCVEVLGDGAAECADGECIVPCDSDAQCIRAAPNPFDGGGNVCRPL